MRGTKIKKLCSSSLWTCLHHMVILRTRNKITDFFMILGWASPFNTAAALADPGSEKKGSVGFGFFFNFSLFRELFKVFAEE